MARQPTRQPPSVAMAEARTQAQFAGVTSWQAHLFARAYHPCHVKSDRPVYGYIRVRTPQQSSRANLEIAPSAPPVTRNATDDVAGESAHSGSSARPHRRLSGNFALQTDRRA